jgi:hypothetical protein
MNLLHHLLVAEKLREKLHWPGSHRGQMLLGAIAPDAHSEVPGIGRSMFHPSPDQDLVATMLELAAPSGCPTTGFQPVESEDFKSPHVIDVGIFTRSLMRGSSHCGLGPIPAAAIDRKRWEVLGRWPLTEGRGRYLIVEPLRTVVWNCAGDALMRMYRSEAGADLLGSWRA